MTTLRFRSRFAVFEAATLVGTFLANLVVAASPHWGPPEAGAYAFMALLGAPVCLLLAGAARTSGQITAGCVFVVGLLLVCGQSMASTDSSTAGLAFLMYPFFGTVAGLGAWGLRDLVAWRSRRAGRRVHQS